MYLSDQLQIYRGVRNFPSSALTALDFSHQEMLISEGSRNAHDGKFATLHENLI